MDTEKEKVNSGNTDQITDKRLLNLKKPWKKGESGNLNGKPLGKRSFKTIYIEAIKKIAEKNGVEPTDLEEQIIMQGLKRANSGDFRFYKDTMDRLHGSPKQSVDLTSGGEKLPQPIMQIQRDAIHTNNSNTKDSSTEEES
jgi:hypothetical protein